MVRNRRPTRSVSVVANLIALVLRTAEKTASSEVIRSDWLESDQFPHVLDLMRHCSTVTFPSGRLVLTKGKEPEDNFFLCMY